MSEKFQWEHGLEIHRIPLTDALMRLIDVAKDDENIEDLAAKQSTTIRYDTRAILSIGVAESEIKRMVAADWDNDLVVTIARAGELISDFLARHFKHSINFSMGKNPDVLFSCWDCDEALTLCRESLMTLED